MWVCRHCCCGTLERKRLTVSKELIGTYKQKGIIFRYKRFCGYTKLIDLKKNVLFWPGCNLHLALVVLSIIVHLFDSIL